jgi:DNA mismatch repair protein MutL
MGRIHVLSDELVKKIAAGEVIERPASVVKELVENALDARAGRIGVHIEDGGRQLVRVTDDGDGMTEDDLRLAVLPHATSKISTQDDLFAIGTMGFRGEALASIGAVSRLRIRSRTPDATAGHEIVVVSEEVELAQAAGCPVGTSVEVRDLFFNVPARRKFLKGASTEAANVNEQFARIALAHPEIAFDLQHNQRVTYRWPGNESFRERVGRFCGSELAKELIAIDWEERGLRVHGYVAPPARSRSASNWQYIFLNGRFIRDRFIQHAVREAYRGLMEPSRHPVVFLFLGIDPAMVDVNVHPTKIEVRWQDSNLIHSQVLAALREKFLRSDLTPALKARDPEEPVAGGAGHRATRPDVDDAWPAWTDAADRRAEDAARCRSTTGGGGGGVPARRPADDPRLRGGPAGGQGHGAAELWRSLHDAADRWPARAGDAEPSPPPPRTRALQVHNAYLVAETDEGILIIDQHALHERVMYDRLRRRLAEGVLDSQRLLLPETVRVTPEQMDVLEVHAELLTRLGLEITPFGRDSIAVNAVPAVLRDSEVTAFVRDVLDRLTDRGNQPTPEVFLEDMLSMMACKAAVKFGDPLSPDEVEALVAQREAVEKSTSCPHGRPTALRFTLADLERQFKRV